MTSKQTHQAQQYGLPTVKADPALFVAYEEMFHRVMGTIAAFSPNEIEEIYERIAKSEGGFLNQGAYFKDVYEQYFEHRDWIWPEFEKWKQIFIQKDKWPVRLRMIFSGDQCKKYELYKLLMLTIDHRSKSLFDNKRQQKLGIKERKLVVVFPDDQEFIELALAETPNALCPLFPGDISAWRLVVPGFS